MPRRKPLVPSRNANGTTASPSKNTGKRSITSLASENSKSGKRARVEDQDEFYVVSSCQLFRGSAADAAKRARIRAEGGGNEALKLYEAKHFSSLRWSRPELSFMSPEGKEQYDALCLAAATHGN